MGMINAKENVPMKNHTTLKIGGPARRFFEPETIEDMAQILQESLEEEAPLFVLGNGSNVLFPDEGYDGWILHLGPNWSGIELVDACRLRVKSGTTNQELARFTRLAGLAGYEFASGIPGTVGGAIVMNAGAYDGETVDVLESVRWLDRRGNLHVAAGEELDMGYRHSRFSDEFGVIVDAVYRLRPGDTKAIEQRIDELTQKRWSKQPMEAASAGSTFKRPAGSFASKLIHESGLQGLRVGDTMVSEKHAGFLINAGEATCGEFLELVRQVQEKVESDSGIRLELEIRRPDAAADAARDAALRRQAETEMEEGEEQED